MPRTAAIGAQLRLDKTQFLAALSSAKSDARAFAAYMSGLSSAPSTRFTELSSKLDIASRSFSVLASAGRGAGTVLKSVFDKEIKLEGLVASLSAASDGTETLTAQMKALREAAKQPGIGFEEVLKGSAALQQARMSPKQSRDIMTEMGNGVARGGGGKQQLLKSFRPSPRYWGGDPCSLKILNRFRTACRGLWVSARDWINRTLKSSSWMQSRL